ncbi:N-acyl amino acid synthase FeeM domain-containing protein [Bdellovibrio sp. HCB2-146]|uniref:N-acyl amino acid synthase FeeM domain-containing protein n=1 Tax=Bdellovibrio sp. HCB2-146 TaxID=3394362 RepID=UPI0039BCE535
MKQQKTFQEQQISAIHGGIVPADVRDGDQIYARLVCQNGPAPFNKEFRVWRMSPLGIELLVQDRTELPKGTPVDLELKIGMQKSTLNGLVVDDVVTENNLHLLHIRLISKIAERVDGIERRESNRWICSEQFFPTAVASNPAKFNDFVYFKVRDLSNGGMKLHTSLRNKFIMPGMSFDCIVNFPMVTQIKMKITVKNLRIEMDGTKEVLALGVTFNKEEKGVSDAVAQYLMQFGSASSLDELLDSGVYVSKVSEAVQFSYVRTKEQYDKVLELRYLAYKDAGKIKEGMTPQDMADEFDSRARIVMGVFKGEVVCSARLIFSQFDDKMEQEKFVKWPAHLPRRDEVVEIMRACTRPDFRGSDLLVSMFKFMAIAVAQSKRKWVVICATDHMAPLYERIGFKQVGLSYEHTGLNNLKHNILVGNVPDAMMGKTVNPIEWNIVWSGVVTYLQQYDMVELEPATNLRLGIYRLLGPVATVVRYFYEKRKADKILMARQAERGEIENKKAS